ncbi:MAG: PilT/PilU family type 4a pilus ATPase, partial [Candidatus Sericytochromatia bacterium]|nr:PilT/PilU family type 4a pilus ATPase [Candidatus Sericytochromatia bacterium]
GVGRFRCNIYQSQGAAGMVLRVIANEILPAEALGLPPVLKKTVFERQGLILITGQTGSGKTTTLAALIEFANTTRRIHVLTLENPVEFVYVPKLAIFTQREMEVDAMSFTNAMRGALRQKPDIILIGEMRDAETITSGLKAAETGHLVMSTLHTNDAIQTINRLINTFPPHEQEAVRVQLASALKASVAQRLIPRADKPGRVASLEIFLVTPNARGENTKVHIQRGNTEAMYAILKTSEYDGMQSQNQALFKHYCNAVISADDALANSDNPDELVRLMREHAGLGGSR